MAGAAQTPFLTTPGIIVSDPIYPVSRGFARPGPVVSWWAYGWASGFKSKAPGKRQGLTLWFRVEHDFSMRTTETETGRCGTRLHRIHNLQRNLPPVARHCL